eukprot:7195-Heterococcus_DN1.PRE.1
MQLCTACITTTVITAAVTATVSNAVRAFTAAMSICGTVHVSATGVSRCMSTSPHKRDTCSHKELPRSAYNEPCSDATAVNTKVVYYHSLMTAF